MIMRAFYDYFLSIRTLRMPVVAAINGHAIGAGVCISLFADMRVAAEDAKMGFNFVNLGLHPVRGLSAGEHADGVCSPSVVELCRVWAARTSSRWSRAQRWPTTCSCRVGWVLVTANSRRKDPRLTVCSECLQLFTGVEAKEFGLVHKAVPTVRPRIHIA